MCTSHDLASTEPRRWLYDCRFNGSCFPPLGNIYQSVTVPIGDLSRSKARCLLKRNDEVELRVRCCDVARHILHLESCKVHVQI